MFDRYPFILPILIVWVIICVIPLILIFYTKLGLSGKRLLNRGLAMKCVSLALFFLAILIIFSGILQLAGETRVIFDKPSGYWHALVGYIFLLAALNHIIIHIKDIWRYIFKSKPEQGPEQ